jgi:hypothetical protein
MRHSRFAVLVIGTIVGHAIQAQSAGAVRGKVVDENGSAIENARVELLPDSRSAITLDDGRFAIVGVRLGTYVLSVRRIGYVPATRSVAVRDSTPTVTIRLVAIPEQLDSIRILEKSAGIRYSAVVLDQNDVPVVGAEVVAMGIDNKLETDSLGRFTVPQLARATLMLRIRKIGYAAYFNSLRMLAERADTIRMPRLATTLSRVEINERSGFGMDEWAYRDLDQRTRWKGSGAGAISREELAQHGTENLCNAMPATPSGNHYVFISSFACPRTFYNVLIDGVSCQKRMLTDFTADEVETIEYFPGPSSDKIHMNSDFSGNLAARGCAPEVYVIWLRHEAEKATPTLVAASAPEPVADTGGHHAPIAPTELPPAALRLHPSHLQGQVVDSTNHPVRAALVYTEDPLFATLTDKNGYFRLGELPAGPIMVRAERDGFVGMEFQLRLPSDSTVGIGLKLLRAAKPFGKVRIDSGADAGVQGRRVRVVSEQGQPIIYANVAVDGATTRITDEKGEISLGTGERRALSMRVSRIGFAPWFGKVDLPAVALVTVTLPEVAHALAPVTVTGEGPIKTSLTRSGFYDRWMMRQKGALSAEFIGPEEIELRHPDKITNVLRGLNGVMVKCDTHNNCYALSTHPSGVDVTKPCPMAIMIDGLQQYQTGGLVNIDEVLDANDVAAVEVYAWGANMPITLQANDTKCGVIAFWTGSRVP